MYHSGVCEKRYHCVIRLLVYVLPFPPRVKVVADQILRTIDGSGTFFRSALTCPLLGFNIDQNGERGCRINFILYLMVPFFANTGYKMRADGSHRNMIKN